MSKGDTQRPSLVSKEEWDKRWDRTFKCSHEKTYKVLSIDKSLSTEYCVECDMTVSIQAALQK